MNALRHFLTPAQAPAPRLAPGKWHAIWENGSALLPPSGWAKDRGLAELTLCIELTIPPLHPKKPLRLWQGAAPAHRAIALYVMADGALRLTHGEVDLSTEPGFARTGETISLRYTTCHRGRSDIADFRNFERQRRCKLRSSIAVVATLEDALPRDKRFLETCHVVAIAEFGLQATDLPAIASGAELMTIEGPVAVDRLEPGMDLVTVDGDLMTLRWIEARPRLCLGRDKPMLLRAPYFGLDSDICVTPETRFMRCGPTVEYIFGEEKVLVRAGDMTASPGARRSHRQPVRQFYHLMLDEHACISVDRCGVETALLSDVVAAQDGTAQANLADTDRTPCMPVLDRAGAQALVAAAAQSGGPVG